MFSTNRSVIIFAISAITVLVTVGFVYVTYSKARQVDPKKLETFSNIIPVAIIGGGPAGLSAALYTARGGLHTVVFAGPELGGQLTKTMYVENWPGTEHTNGTELMDVVRHQSEKFGALVANDSISKVDFSSWPFKLVTKSGDIVHALTVIIATGGVMKKMGVAGEDEYLGKGVAICGVCDAALFKGEDVVVVGGGDAAVQEAMLVAKYARHVTQIVGGTQMKATKCMQDRLLKHKNVSVLYNTRVTEIIGDNTKVTAVQLHNTLSSIDTKLPVTGVFIGIGQAPNTQLFKDQLACTKDGYIELQGRSQKSSIPGVYVAGSAAESKSTQAAVSSGDAIKAALSAMDFLNDHEITDLYLNKISGKFYTPKEVVDREKISAMLLDRLLILVA